MQDVFTKITVDGVDQYIPRRLIVPKYSIGMSVSYRNSREELMYGKIVGCRTEIVQIKGFGFDEEVAYKIQHANGHSEVIDEAQVED